jgi:hypothetical protein
VQPSLGGPEEAREWWPQFSTEERHGVIEAQSLQESR